MDITIVIPVADDIRVKKCIESIDEDCEILIVANRPTSNVNNILKFLKHKYRNNIRILEINERNLGLARDFGIREAKNDRVLIMDSDCIFKKGTIRLLYQGLEHHKIAKGRVIFLSDSFISNIIKRVREYTTSDKVSAFAPPLAIRKEIIYEIGGYYFDHDIHWVDDAEFDLRVRKNKIKINYIPNAMIYHPPLTIWEDLRSAFRYGYGKRIGVRKGLMTGVGAFWVNLPDVIKRKGFLPAFYLILWNIIYTIGFFLQPYLDIYNIELVSKLFIV